MAEEQGEKNEGVEGVGEEEAKLLKDPAFMRAFAETYRAMKGTAPDGQDPSADGAEDDGPTGKFGQWLSTADDDDAYSVKIKLHAKQWREILQIKSYETAKGNRKCRSISGTIYSIVDDKFHGIEAAQSKQKLQGAQPQKPRAKVDFPSEEAH